MKRILISLKSLLIVSLCLISVAYAVPNLISYQGVLNDDSGVPISSTVTMTFRIYDVATGGTTLWTEAQSVQVFNGVFNVKLGSVQALTSSVFNQDSIFLGIQVGSDPEMAPRQRITAGAYMQTIVPIGTIMAWAKSLPGVPAISEGWVECNGQVLNDPQSPLNGQTIPDLNGQNRFLRGASTSGGIGGEESHVLTIPEMPSHQHSYTVSHGNTPGSFYGQLGNRNSETRNTGNTGSNNPHETRPPYFDIVWIMRIK